MKYFYRWALSLMLISASHFAWSCDFCSCGSISLGLGDWANQGRSLISSSYSLRQFQGPNSQDQFHQFQLRAIWALDEVWQLKFNAPWVIAEREIEESEERKVLNELGDVSLNIQARAWTKISSQSLQNLYLSLGVQLPSGNFENRPIESLFAPNFQAGSGSLDFLGTLQYEIAWGKNLLVYQSSYASNQRNSFNYRFGDQWLQSLKYGRRISLSENLALLTFLNLDYEIIERDVNSRGFYQFGSGGQAWFIGLGSQLSSQAWNLGLQFQLRPWEALGAYQAQSQISTTLSYFL